MADPRAVQARLQLVMFLYKETLQGVAGALEVAKQAPLRAEEKETLYAEVERAVWAFPEALFAVERDDWSEVADEPAVRDALERGVMRILTARKKGLPAP